MQVWIGLGCSLFALNQHGRTPLLAFLGFCAAYSNHTWSTEDLCHIQYWAKCISDSGVDLTGYGTEEIRSWRTDIRVGSRYRNDDPEGFGIEVYATGFRFGASYDKWHLETQQKVSIQVYRIDTTPGSWPGAMTLPPTIVWYPSRADIRDDETYTAIRTVDITLSPLPREQPLLECLTLFEGTQDDNIALARLLSANNTRTTKRRRRGSQPPPVSRLSSRTCFFYPRGILVSSYFCYCPICCKKILTRSPSCHRWDHTQETCFEKPVWDVEHIVTDLLRWKQFVTEHGARPAQCDRYHPSPLTPVRNQVVEAESFFDDFDRFAFC